MRSHVTVTLAALLLAPAWAEAQDSGSSSQRDTPQTAAAASLTDATAGNRLDVGLRGTSFGGGSDRARFQRYRDVRDGGTVDLLQFRKNTDTYLFDAHADHVGYRDQSFAGSFNRFGKINASFEWNQVPLFYSDNTSSLYSNEGGGALRIVNPAIRSGIQNGTLSLRNVNQFLGSPFELRQRRDTAAFNLVAALSKTADVRVSVKSTHKAGEMPWGATFGFSAMNEVAAPIDHRTNDVGAALEWANPQGMARVGYDGSWFINHIPTLVYDSPFKLTDSTNPSAYVSGNGTSQGRTAMWPDSMANTASAAAAYNLPWRSRINGAVSIGDWRQNAALLPYTINSAIAPIPLDRPTADTDARITSYNVNIVSRPTPSIWLNVRSRRYDFDNRTREFRVNNYVRVDQVVEPSTVGHTEPFGYKRDYFDADASFTPIPYTALKVGYGLEKVDRTFRFVERTDERTLRAALDTAGLQYVTLRVGYEHGRRTGSGLDEEAFDEIGEQVSLRQFDISNRDRDRVTALAQIIPFSRLAITASAQVGRDTRPDANFGLRKFDANNYSMGFDLTPIDTVSLGLTYSYEDVKTNQKSRQASPGAQFADPTRDWSTDMSEKVHYVVASLDLLKTIPRSDLTVAFDWNRSNTDYAYGLPPNTTLATPTPLPRLYNELQRATVDFKYFLGRHVAAGFVYMYDSYKVDDFALSPNYVIGNRTLSDGIMLGYFFRPYKANTGWLRLSYLW